jgi:dienelactone hydrolase
MVGTCATMDYVATAEKTALDIDGALEYLTQHDDKVSGQVVLVGHSHGGFGNLGVAADPPKGVMGIVNFAGGTGDWAGRLRRLFLGKFCNGRQRLLAALEQLGRQNSLPQIWLYAQNDRTFDPETARAMLDAYQKTSHAPVTFVSLPPSSKDGHMLFANENATTWALPVDGFLRKLDIRGYRSPE